jgi:hypothetical protein
MDSHGRPTASRPQQMHVAGREQGAGPGPPGGPAAGGPDGRVEALLAERALDHRDGHGGGAVVVGGGDQPGRPPEEPGLGLRGDQQGDRPRPVGRARGHGPGLLGQVGGQLDELGREAGGGEGAHAGVLCCGRAGRTTGPGGRLASAGGRSRTPGPGTRAGPDRPQCEAGVAGGGVPVRHGNRGGCRQRRRLSSRCGPQRRLYQIETIPCCSGCLINRVN